jgi:hypothetical protein
MFDQIARQLELQTLGKSKNNFKIDREEFDQFCKSYLFEQIKGNMTLGTYFCEKYDETNHVLSILHNKAARQHIKTFYVR